MTTTTAAPRGTPRPYTRTSRAHAPTRNPSRKHQFDGPDPRPCATCAFYAPDATGEGVGECRRFPPQPARDGHGYYLAQIPPSHYCGLWLERPTAETAETVASSDTVDTIGG